MAAEDEVAAVMVRAGVPADRIAAATALTGGTYNALHAVDLTDGTRLVVKVPPPAHLPRLRYEAGLLHGEERFYACAEAAQVPAPRVVRAEPDEGGGQPPYLVMTHCPGRPWHVVVEDGGIDGAEHARLRGELGTLVARLHAVRGPGFGYPSHSTGPLTDRWAPAFAAMTGALLDDAERYGAWLPVGVDEARAVFAAAGPALAEVAVPALVHFDLWPGNVLLDGPPGARRIGGLIDGERMFWGDPLADFASLGLAGVDPEDDPDFRAGYAAAGGSTGWDAAARRRIALYRAYLYLIMLVEAVPRRYEGEHLSWVRDFAGSRLTRNLAAAG
ncbi:Fructosamine-3-kinase [Actinacidiphila yanglinensis]|uniref:Fructosamine-3-kinase n=1 Tax=Actinacidiphila yanglinensis TaxID=310779 RepID=A0A1H6CXN3_9ACTN|nr:aminoglycoside phosphotransferase family protein [Actinacidiphila yanglinensis]SEG77196.1 Fructosamine-3-kinase [Actinacidiphila yanglinensis]